MMAEILNAEYECNPSNRSRDSKTNINMDTETAAQKPLFRIQEC
jgi:hypothetical protein